MSYGPAATARQTTELYAECQVCHQQWQVWGDPPTNTKGCSFCDAPEDAILIHSEAIKVASGHTVKQTG